MNASWKVGQYSHTSLTSKSEEALLVEGTLSVIWLAGLPDCPSP